MKKLYSILCDIYRGFNSLCPDMHTQILQTNISLKNYLEEIDKRSSIFLLVIISLILPTFSLDDVLILLGES